MSNPKISPKHLLPPEDRKSVTNPTKFKKSESILADIYADMGNGFTRSEVKAKLMEGLYEAQKGKAIKDCQASAYVRTVEERLRQDFENQRGELSNKIALAYLTVYQDALKDKDRMNANKALDGLAKLIAGNTPQTAIQINGTKDGSVMVNFGFSMPTSDVDADDKL